MLPASIQENICIAHIGKFEVSVNLRHRQKVYIYCNTKLLSNNILSLIYCLLIKPISISFRKRKTKSYDVHNQVNKTSCKMIRQLIREHVYLWSKYLKIFNNFFLLFQIVLADVPGTGKEGRILKEDIMHYLEEIKTKTISGTFFPTFFQVNFEKICFHFLIHCCWMSFAMSSQPLPPQ